MNRRSFGLLIRFIAVLAAIYALLIFRSHLPRDKPAQGPIPVRVVSETKTDCGSITVRPVTLTDLNGPKAPIEENPAIAKAIQAAGEPVPVRNPAECERLAKLHDSVFSTEKGSIRIQFEAK